MIEKLTTFEVKEGDEHYTVQIHDTLDGKMLHVEDIGDETFLFVPLPMVPDFHMAIAKAWDHHQEEEAARKLLLEEPIKSVSLDEEPKKCSACNENWPGQYHLAFYDPFNPPIGKKGSAGYYRDHLCMGCYFDYLADAMGTRANNARKEAAERA